MALFSQFKSLFQLPGAFRRASDAAVQAQTLQQKLDAIRAQRPKAIQTPTLTPSVPPTPRISPSPAPSAAPVQANPQFDAIKRGLEGLTTGLQGLSKSAASTPQAPTYPENLKSLENEIIGSTGVGTEELEAQRKLSNLLASRDLGLIQAESQAVPLQAILGEQGRIERRANVAGGTLEQQLAQAQARRKSALDVAKTKYDIEKTRFEATKPDEEKITEFTDAEGKKVIVFRDKKTGKTRQEVLSEVFQKPAVGTQTDRDRALKSAAISKARPLLITSRRQDGYVDPSTYLKMRSDYGEAIGNIRDFDAVFAPMLSPEQRKRLGVGQASLTTDIDALLSGFLGAGASQPADNE